MNIIIEPSHKLFQIAVKKGNGMTKKDMREEVKSLGLKPIQAHVDALAQAIDKMMILRKRAKQIRIFNKLGYTKLSYYDSRHHYWRYSSDYTHGKQSWPKKAIGAASLSQRLFEFKTAKVKRNLPPLRFDVSPEIYFSTDPAGIGVSQSDWLNWDYYSKSTRFPKKQVGTTFFLPLDWSRRVLDNGLSSLGGMFTLDAQPLEAPEGVKLYLAKWVSQGRGYSLVEQSGFIALSGDTEFHADTAAKAVAGLERKLKAKGLTAALSGLLGDLNATASKHPHLTVTVSDAKAAGACDYGIRSWCNRVNITSTSVSIAEMVAAYSLAPNYYARAAIIFAIKRQRKSLQV